MPRCESCGGPSDDGTLCATCRQVFQPFLNTVPPQPEWPAAVEPTAHAADAVEPMHFEAVALESALEAATRGDVAAPVPVRDEAVDAESVGLETVRQAIEPDVARPEADGDVIMIKAESHAPEPIRPQAQPAQAAANKVVPIEKPRAAPKAATPGAPAKRAAAPAGRSRTDWMIGAVAAVAIVAAIGMGWGAFWLKTQREPAAEPAQASPAAAVPATPEAPAVRPEVLEAAARVQADMAAMAARERKAAEPAPSAKTKTAAANAASPRTPAKNVRQAVAPAAPQVASVAAPARAEVPVREVEAPAPAPVAAAPAPAAAATASIEPLRPYFEPRDVSESPQVANRVEPRLPVELQGRAVSDVVVVRLLVSQSGHPSSISLLRKSRTGQPLDDAVVAAVKQWTFLPARRKGEAVSCWLNVGVPVGRAN